jgi:hypothetical protein
MSVRPLILSQRMYAVPPHAHKFARKKVSAETLSSLTQSRELCARFSLNASLYRVVCSPPLGDDQLYLLLLVGKVRFEPTQPTALDLQSSTTLQLRRLPMYTYVFAKNSSNH